MRNEQDCDYNELFPYYMAILKHTFGTPITLPTKYVYYKDTYSYWLYNYFMVAIKLERFAQLPNLFIM